MTTVNGYETLFAMKKESTAGTAVAVGAGDRIDAKKITLNAKKNLKRDEDSLIPTVKKAWLNQQIPELNFDAYAPYWGNELLFGILMGSCTVSSHHSGHPLAYTIEYNRDTLSNALTAAFSLGEGHATADMLRVLEVSGFKFSEFSIDQGNGEEPGTSWVGGGKAQTRDSTTNDSSNLDAVTFLDAAYPSRPATFDDLAVYLAHQDSTSFDSDEEIDASGFNLKIGTGIEVDTEKHLATSGAMVPVATARLMAELAVRFLRDNTASDVFRQYADDCEKLKAKLDYTSDQGIPGMSVSAATPSTDISGSSNTNLNITFTDQVSGDSESVEVVLSVGTLTTDTLIAEAVQTTFRAATATNSRFQKTLNKLTCDYNSTVSAKYAITIASNERVNVEVIAASTKDLSVELKLGTPGSGDEYDAVAYRKIYYIPEIVLEPVGEDVSGGVNEVEFKGTASTAYGSTAPFGFDADDDDLLSTDLDGSNGQDIRIVTVGRVATSPLA